MARIYDRWWKTVDGDKVKTAAHGVERRWQVRYDDPSGKEVTKTFRRKPDAKRWLDETTTDLVSGRYVDPKAGRTTFREYAETWRTSQVHRATSAAKVESILRLHAYPTLGDRQLASILPSHVQAWVKGLPLAPSTVAVVHGVVASVFKAAVRDRLVFASPCEGTKLPEDHREEVTPLATDQVLALTAALPPRYRALVTIGAATGLRISEATGLTIGCHRGCSKCEPGCDRSGIKPPSASPRVRVDRQLVVLTGKEPYLGPPKRKASIRDVPLPTVAVEALARHLGAFPATPRDVVCRDLAGRTRTETVEFVFTTETGGPIRRNALSRAWRPAVEAAGLPDGTSYHDLRHYYASLLIGHSESVKVVQARLGHATAAETLDTYSHLWPDSEDRTRVAVDSVLGEAATEPARNAKALS